MISEAMNSCLIKVNEARKDIAGYRHDANAYKLQAEGMTKQSQEQTRLADEKQKELDAELLVLRSLLGSLKHFSPYQATVGALLEKMSEQAMPESISQADGVADDPVLIGREG